MELSWRRATGAGRTPLGLLLGRGEIQHRAKFGKQLSWNFDRNLMEGKGETCSCRVTVRGKG